jgi:hypothetical protein
MTTTPTMLAVLIDPEARDPIQAITLDTRAGSLAALYQAIGCTCVDVVRLTSSGLDMWIDDEGLLHERPRLFVLPGFGQPYAGRAVILRSDPEGETIGLTEAEQARILDLMRRHVLFPVFAPEH